MKRQSIISAFESNDEVIEIGAPQSLITLNDAVGAIKDADASSTGIVPPAQSDLITINDAMKGIADGTPVPPSDPVVPETPVPVPEVVVPEVDPLEDDMDLDGTPDDVQVDEIPDADAEAEVEVEVAAAGDDGLDGETEVVPEEAELDDTIDTAGDDDTGELEGEDSSDVELDLLEDEDPEFDDLDEADAPEEESDDDEAELAALNDVHKSLESIAVEIHGTIRRGGLTVAQAKVQEGVLTTLLTKANLDVSKYVISHESFSKDAIAVTMEADRSIMDSIREVVAKIIAALKAAWETTSTYVKSLLNVSAKLKAHSLEIQGKIATLNFSEEVKVKKFDVSKYAKALGVHGKSVIDPEEAMRLVIEGGTKMTAFTNETKGLAVKLLAEIKTYKHGDYVAMFEPAVAKIIEANSPLLPGGKGIAKDDTNMIKLVQKDPEVSGTFEITVPAPAALKVICERITDISTFVDTYGKLVLDAEATIKDLVSSMEKAAPSAIPSDDTEALAEAKAVGTFVKDSKAVIDHIRGCSAAYIRLAETTAEQSLKYVSYCMKQY
jgi:hypothetical protein